MADENTPGDEEYEEVDPLPPVPGEKKETKTASLADPAYVVQREEEAPGGIRVIHMLDGSIMRINAAGQKLCRARRSDGHRCLTPVSSGHLVCHRHGAGLPQVRRAAKLRLAELVDPAVGVLAREMVNADKSTDRIRAANSVLDRAGYGRVQRVESSEVKQQFYDRLRALADGEDETDEQD